MFRKKKKQITLLQHCNKSMTVDAVKLFLLSILYMRLILGAGIHATHCVQQACCERSPLGNLQHLHCVSEDNIHQCSMKIICQLYSIYIRLHSPPHLLLALPPKLTQMRRQEIVISPRLCMKIKLGIAFVLDSLPCKQRSCFLIFM